MPSTSHRGLTRPAAPAALSSQRPTVFFEPAIEKIHQDLSLAEVKHPPKPASAAVGRNAPCPCGSPLKFKRCCGNPVPQARAA